MNVADYFDDLEEHEGCTTWLYCDGRGYVTVGIGNLVASPEQCAAYPFAHKDGSPATPEEKASAWAAVNDAFDKTRSAVYYTHASDLRLTTAFVRELVGKRLENEFIPGIRKLCHDFDAWPLPARRAIVDMAYNLGVGGLAKFHHLISACQARDWAGAAAQCHRATCRDMRNAWTMQCFIDAAADTPTPAPTT